jgi:hypothetical protein
MAIFIVFSRYQYDDGRSHSDLARKKGYIDDGHGEMGIIALIGYKNDDPVYRTTHTVALSEVAIMQ